jgi:hypothetical protein
MQQGFSYLLRLITHKVHSSFSDDLHLFSWTNRFNCTDKCSVGDPNPACHFNADPDPTILFRADPDPGFQMKAKNLEKVLNRLRTFWLVICKLMRIRIQLITFHADPDPDPTFHLIRIQIRNNRLVVD